MALRDCPDQALPPSRVDPLQGRKVKQSEGPAENHANQHHYDRGFGESLVQAEVVIRAVSELLQAT